jgi:hypothetical protein
MKRKAVQISTVSTIVGSIAFSTLIVLCDDGALLQYSPRQEPQWTQFPDIPDSDETLTAFDPNGHP